ncbi:MAG: protein kinase [Solobacterium sp.]|nr:protein kinase [Solobacterium sp.]
MAQILNNTYEILEFIGKGGMSTVFKAKHIRLNTIVAVKAVRKDQTIDLLAEVNILTRLNHPNLVKVLDIFDDEKLMYIVMDYVEGEDLQHIIQREKVIPEETVMEWFRTLADAMRYLHTRKPPIIYRDMKPANVILQNDGTLKIIDFGIAREYKAAATNDTTHIGTNGFAAPEQFGLAQTDARTDIYSLGMTMYYLATGKSPLAPPYGYTPARKLNPNISEKLEAILERCIKDNPEDRYQTDDELLYDLYDGMTAPVYQTGTAGFRTEQTHTGTGPMQTGQMNNYSYGQNTGFTAGSAASPKTGDQNEYRYEQPADTGAQPFTGNVQQSVPSKKVNGKTIGIIGAAAAVLLAGIFLFMPKGSSDTSPAVPANDSAAPAAAASDETPEGSGQDNVPEGSADNGPDASEPAAAVSSDTTLVYEAESLSGSFSPFYTLTTGDTDVKNAVFLSLLTTDRQGAVINHAIDGETKPFNGTEYTYYGPADLTVKQNSNGTSEYTFKLREDLVFSDGRPLTADDVLFTMYVLADPLYDGSSDFNTLPISGLDDYRSSMTSLADMLIDAGPGNTDFSKWDKQTQDAFWEDLQPAGEKFVREIYDYLMDNGYCTGNETKAEMMKLWNFDVPEDATDFEIFLLMLEAYDNDLTEMTDIEHAYSEFKDLMPSYYDYHKGIRTGSTDRIEGIQKLDDYTVSVRMTKTDPADVYKFDIPIAPMHYYGETSKYDEAAGKFGFDQGDLSHVRSVSEPMGAGPYRFVKYEQGTVYFEANASYYKGAPKTGNLRFISKMSDSPVDSIVSGEADVTSPGRYDYVDYDLLRTYSPSLEISGPTLTTAAYDRPAYGYIAIAADLVNVNGERGSEQSRNLRKAFATIFSVYRDEAVELYYDEIASVIEYPMSKTSWACPQPGDPDYKRAFMETADGMEIYSSDMSEAERCEAAIEAALQYFEAAGCTVQNGKVTGAPAGVPLNSRGQIQYMLGFPGGGTGDHVAYWLAEKAREALATINVSLIVADLSSSELYQYMQNREMHMWCAVWNVPFEPDMYSIYYSDIANGGKNPGANTVYSYGIQDETLDSLILEAGQSLDPDERKELYHEAMGIVSDWAVEVPYFQRKYITIFSTERVNTDTVTPDITAYYGWMKEIENIEVYE